MFESILLKEDEFCHGSELLSTIVSGGKGEEVCPTECPESEQSLTLLHYHRDLPVQKKIYKFDSSCLCKGLDGD